MSSSTLGEERHVPSRDTFRDTVAWKGEYRILDGVSTEIL